MRLRPWLVAGVLAVALVAFAAPAAQASPPPWKKMQRAINDVRRAHDLRPVRHARSLQRAARRHSWDMFDRGFFSHVSPSGSTLSTRIHAARFRTSGAWSAGEVIAWGAGRRGKAKRTLRGWMNSPPHRAIILSPSFRLLGVGRAKGTWRGYSNVRIWTADFGHR